MLILILILIIITYVIIFCIDIAYQRENRIKKEEKEELEYLNKMSFQKMIWDAEDYLAKGDWKGWYKDIGWIRDTDYGYLVIESHDKMVLRTVREISTLVYACKDIWGSTALPGFLTTPEIFRKELINRYTNNGQIYSGKLLNLGLFRTI